MNSDDKSHPSVKGMKDKDKQRLFFDYFDEEKEDDEEFDDKRDGKEVWCICRSTAIDRFMIGCDNCEEWFHGDCVGVTEKDAKIIKNYYCFQCIRRNPRLSIVRKTGELPKTKKRRTSTTESTLPQKKRFRQDKPPFKQKPATNMPTFLDSDAEESDDEIDVGDEKEPFRSDRPPLSKPSGMSIKPLAQPSSANQTNESLAVESRSQSEEASCDSPDFRSRRMPEPLDVDNFEDEDDDDAFSAPWKRPSVPPPPPPPPPESASRAEPLPSWAVGDAEEEEEEEDDFEPPYVGAPVKAPAPVPPRPQNSTAAAAPAAPPPQPPPRLTSPPAKAKVSAGKSSSKKSKGKSKKNTAMKTSKKDRKSGSPGPGSSQWETRRRRRKSELSGNRAQRNLRSDSDSDSEYDDEPRQCFGPRCTKEARRRSKYCSNDCGLRLAYNRIFEILPMRITQWNSSPCIAEEQNKKQLERIRADLQKCREKCCQMEKDAHALAALQERIKTMKVDKNYEPGDADEAEQLDQIICVTCGNEVNLRSALRHMEKCFAKIESQSSFGTVYKSKDGANLFCDAYNKQAMTYCKRLKVICPEHSKDAKISSDAICGFPLMKDVYQETETFCRAPKRRCTRHFLHWERIRKARIDVEVVRQLMKMEDLMNEEREIRAAMTDRSGVLSLMLHQTICHDPQRSQNYAT